MKNNFNRIGISDELDIPRTKLLMKLGIFSSIIALSADIVLGCGAARFAVSGIPATLARYLAMSDGRLLWSAILAKSMFSISSRTSRLHLFRRT